MSGGGPSAQPSGAFVIGDRFAEEVAAAAPLPPHAFDPRIERQAVADKYQTVAFDTNRYSVPRFWAFREVTVKGYVDQIVVAAGGQVVATHARCHGHSQHVLDPVHYRAALGAARPRWTTRRWTATGSRRRHWPGYAANWRRSTACRVGRGSSSGSCNCSPNTRGRGSSVRSRRAARGTPSRPRRSSSGPGRWRPPRPGGHPRSIVHVKEQLRHGSRSRRPTCRGSTGCSAGRRQPGQGCDMRLRHRLMSGRRVGARPHVP